MVGSDELVSSTLIPPTHAGDARFTEAPVREDNPLINPL
jgi:hypothetical protein